MNDNTTKKSQTHGKSKSKSKTKTITTSGAKTVKVHSHHTSALARPTKKTRNMYTRKTKITGSSTQTTIPKAITRKLDIHPGDTVQFIELDTGDVLLKKATEEPKVELSTDFLMALEEGMEQYDEALRSLVER